jgi:hypothetical protein
MFSTQDLSERNTVLAATDYPSEQGGRANERVLQPNLVKLLATRSGQVGESLYMLISGGVPV